jgi:hypothetical protein
VKRKAEQKVLRELNGYRREKYGAHVLTHSK